MDYKGQQLSELIFYWIILLFGGVGWVLGYIRQEFWIVFQFWLVGVAISLVVSFCGCDAIVLDQGYDNKPMFWMAQQQPNKKQKRCNNVSLFPSYYLTQECCYSRLPCSLLFFSLQLCVPDWPFYNRNPIQWLDTVPNRRGSKE
jgi:Microsomal signal peptidase 12 kDa subunit (SPC12)